MVNPLLASVFFSHPLSHIAVVAREQEMCNVEIVPCQSNKPTRSKVLISKNRNAVWLFKGIELFGS